MKPIHLLIAVAITCLWGFNFSVIKAGVDNMDPFILAGLRFAFAAVPLIFFVKRPQVSWIYLVSYGMIFGIGVWGLMSLSIDQGLSAGMAGVILELSAFISVLFGLVLLNERISFAACAGLIISFSGLVLVFQIQDGSVTFTGIFLAIFAAISLSIVNIIVKKSNSKEMFAFVVWSSAFAPIPLFALAYIVNGASGFSAIKNDFSLIAGASVLFQAYPTTVLGYWAWNKLLLTYPLSTIAPLKLLIPIFALLGSAIFYNEQIQGVKMLACTLIVAGVGVPIFYQLLKHLKQHTPRVSRLKRP